MAHAGRASGAEGINVLQGPAQDFVVKVEVMPSSALKRMALKARFCVLADKSRPRARWVKRLSNFCSLGSELGMDLRAVTYWRSQYT